MSNYLKKKFDHLFRLMVGLALYFFDSILLFLLPIAKPSKKSILVIRLDRIGDYILWAGQENALRKKFPKDQYQLILLANEIWAPLLCGSDIFDEILPVQVRRLNYPWLYRYQVAKEIRQRGFGVVINPLYSREFYRSDELVRLSGAPISIGLEGDISSQKPILRSIANRSYTELLEVESTLTELEINAAFVSLLGIDTKPLLAKLDVADIALPGDLIKNEYFIISPGASSGNRRWPIENFAKVVEKIQTQHSFLGVICGDLSDGILAMQLNQLLKTQLIDLTGKTDIRSLVKIISDARLLISNESGIAHIGAAVRTPTAVLIGGGHYGRFFPYKGLEFNLPVEMINFQMDCYGCNWHCHYTASNQELVPCVSKISLDQAMDKIDLLLKSSD